MRMSWNFKTVLFSIAIVAVVFGGIFLYCNQLVAMRALKDEFANYQRVVHVQVADLRAQINELRNNNEPGIITGGLTYPSEGLPKDLKVCAQNNKTAEIICTQKDISGDATYALSVPAGEYLVFAQSGKLKAYYSEFVICGLDADKCKTHTPVIIKIAAGEKLENITPGDWYAP